MLVFDCTAKCGLRQTETIDDPDLLDAAGAMLRRRKGGIDELLVYRDGRSSRRVTSTDINAYLKMSWPWTSPRRTSALARTVPAVADEFTTGARGPRTPRCGDP